MERGSQPMRRLTVPLVLAFLLGGSLQAQEEGSEATVGYLRIFTDADRVQIYIDGELIGYTPIPEKIPVTPGWHHVSFFSPDFKKEHWTYRQRRVLVDVVEAGIYRVLVEPGKLEEVHMEWHDLERVLLRYESSRWISAAVGVAMAAAVLMLLVMSS